MDTHCMHGYYFLIPYSVNVRSTEEVRRKNSADEKVFEGVAEGLDGMCGSTVASLPRGIDPQHQHTAVPLYNAPTARTPSSIRSQCMDTLPLPLYTLQTTQDFNTPSPKGVLKLTIQSHPTPRQSDSRAAVTNCISSET